MTKKNYIFEVLKNSKKNIITEKKNGFKIV